MSERIERDADRFKEIVHGRIRKNLRKYVSHGEMIGRRGKDYVSIPIPQLEIPRFRYGKDQGGVGQGDGDPGDPVSGDPKPGKGGPAGSEPGEHLMEVYVTLDELADLLGEELELPRIEPRGKQNIDEERPKYRSIRRVGPESLRHFKRTYREALKRQVAEGAYDPVRPLVVPLREDRRYRSFKTEREPRAAAAIIYIMDVSGSMTDDQKAIVRTEAFWIDTWLSRQYGGVERRYIIHDASAREVDETTFYRTRESGGTRISSAYRVCRDLIRSQFPPSDWNNYVFQFSDGDNWGEDSVQAFRLLRDDLLPAANLFCYGQVHSPYGSGEFLKQLQQEFGDRRENLVVSQIAGPEGILDSIKTFLGKGR